MPGKVVSILNMKGGVGKTTIAAHVFRVLYLNKRKRVLLLDLDAQFNLTQSIITQTDYDKIQADNKTILSCFEPAPATDFFAVKKSTVPPPSAESLATTLKKLNVPNQARLDLIAGDFRIVKYSHHR